jgi:nicotinate-nucleotide adenylyltransferase
MTSMAEPADLRPCIALFGGAFDPPHLGHVLCAHYALARYQPAALWVLPSCQHPYGKRMAPFGRRLALCRAAFAGLSGVTVRDDETDNHAGYTFTLLELLEQRHPGHRWALVGGSDTRDDLHRWHRGAELAQRVSVFAVPRRGYDDEDPAALPAISSSQVRERLATGQPVEGLLPAAVARLLAETNEYRLS